MRQASCLTKILFSQLIWSLVVRYSQVIYCYDASNSELFQRSNAVNNSFEHVQKQLRGFFD